MAVNRTYFFVIQFTFRSESGLAIVLAGSDKEAFCILKNSGMHSAYGQGYKLVRIQNVGRYEPVNCYGESYGLQLEAYTNAVVAYDAIKSVAKDIIGPQGEKGDTGEKGDKGDPGSDADVTTENITNALGYTPASQTEVEEKVSGTGVSQIIALTQEEYDALPVKRPDVLYVIK